MKVYTVTTIAPAGPKYGGTRLIAICTSPSEAFAIITENRADIYETSYRYAVVEPVETDVVYGMGDDFRNATWFEWKAGGYKQIEAPEEFLRIIGFWGAGPIRNSLIEKATE